jgi:acyl-CoA:acyl-CoA alkyltransferase
MIKKICISEVSSYLPKNIIDNKIIEKRLNQHIELIPPGSLERLFGSIERRYADEQEQVSDLAVKAALPIVEKVGRERIDLLIFSAACADVIEPATANIVQHKLRLTCPVFDLKNACNSSVTALQVGSAMIQSGQYQRVLIVNGEKLQDAVQFNVDNKQDLRKYIAGYTLGDAGAAMLLEPSQDDSGILIQRFKTCGKYWDLCTVPGGGSLHPHSSDFNYFEGKTSEMHQAFLSEFGDMFETVFAETGLVADDIDHYFMHQVSVHTFDVVANHCRLPRERFFHSFAQYGNIAAATIPVNLSIMVEQGRIKKGDKIMLIGIAAGISIGIQILIW